MLLEGTRVVQLGCGIAGDICGTILTRLGAEVVRIEIDPCPACGEDCDGDEAWRARFLDQKRTAHLPRGAKLSSYEFDNERIDGAIVDGLPRIWLDDWRIVAKNSQVSTVVLTTVGLEWAGDVIEADGLGAEATSGVVGTMGPAAGPPTPFGYFYGESNVAVRAAAVLVDRLLQQEPDGIHQDEDLITEVSAADACIDAMDNPWQEFSLPGPVHQVSNSLTNQNYRRTGPQRAGLVPYGLFKARDGWVCLVGASTTELLADRLNRPELVFDPRFGTIDARVANREFVVDLIQEWVSTFDSGEAFVDYLGNDTVVAMSRRLDELNEHDTDLLGFSSPAAPFRISASLPD